MRKITERVLKRVGRDERDAQNLRLLDEMDRVLHDYTSNDELEKRDNEWRERAKQDSVLKYESQKRAW